MWQTRLDFAVWTRRRLVFCLGSVGCWNALESVCILTRSLNYDLNIPKTIFVCLLCDFMTLVICLLCFHSSVLLSCFVVSTCSRKNRFHTQHTDLSIFIGSHQQTADTNSHGWSCPNTLPWRIGVVDVGRRQYCP